MRILRSTHSVNPAVGGPIESIQQSSAALRARGHEVEILSLDAPTDTWVRASPIQVHALGSGRGGYAYSPRFAPWIKAHRDEYDAVIIHGLWNYSSFGVWRALRGGRTPYFVFPHGMLDPWFNRTYPLKHLKKLLYWRWADYRVLRDAAAVLFTSEEERRLARQSFAQYQCREEVVSYGTAAPAVDLEQAREKFLAQFPQLRGQRLLLFLGRLHEKKGCDLLIDAFVRVAPGMHLVMVGPPANENYLQSLKQRADEKITFTGMLSGDLKWGALAAAEVFILPSHQENFGIAVVEALACGRPVLISDQVNIWREIVADGAGLAEPDDLEGTMRLLTRWLSLGERDKAAMSSAAQALFQKRFEIESAVSSLLEVMNRYVGSC